MTCAAGSTYTYDYYPFGGESVVTQNLANQHYKFEGKERDPESGLDNFGARFSNSNMGRFMSPDWASSPEPVPYSKLSSPQSFNLYAFAGNNPESAPDLDGHEADDTLDGFNNKFDAAMGSACAGGTSTACGGSGSDESSGRHGPGGSEGTPEVKNGSPAQQTKTDNLSNVVENETSSLKPDPNAKPGQPGSAENLAAGLLAIAEIANRVIDAGHPDRVASSTLYDIEAAGLKRGDPAAVDAHNRSRTAAEAAINGSNTTNGATKYRTRVGSNVTTPLGKSKTNPGTPVSMSFGPFIEGKHTVVIVVAP